MVKKKIDNRLRILIENGIKSNHRSLIVVVGDKGRDQVKSLNTIFSKSINFILGCNSSSYAF